jgi:hypothetical protein
MYPTFTIESIQQRCSHDINAFKTEFHLTIEVEPLATTSVKKRIAHLLKEFKKLGIHSYVHDIKQCSSQHEAWILRTQLFYQLLLLATLTFQSKALYDKTYKDIPFRPDVTPMLPFFKMGIFGSMTPTSDIDIGIQYSGPPLEPALAYIVSRFENLFLLYTGKPSIEFDIETYADMMTIPNPDPDPLHPDYFYLDTSGFTEVEYKRMLPIAANSILRNSYFISPETVKNVTLSDVLKPFQLPSMPDFLDVSRKTVLDFMTGSYEKGRQIYYKKVEMAEKTKNEKLRGPMTPSDICDIMVAIGEALTYRYESYTCSPTVIHVVRILQASKEKAQKYRTLVPKTYCKGDIVHLDPFCTIGKYGYALSMLEQLGYMYRFYKLYCTTQPEYCKKKVDKYWKRYKDAKFYKRKYERKTRRRYSL